MGHRGRRFVLEHHDRRKLAAEYIEILQRLLPASATGKCRIDYILP